jgi:hypothetical protein
MESLPALNPESLQLVRKRLSAMRRTSLASRDDRYRGWLDEATAWLDAGVYGRCSVCGRALDAAHIVTHPEQKCCHECRFEAQVAGRERFCIGSCPSSVRRNDTAQRENVCPRVWSTREPGDRPIEAFLRAAELWSYHEDGAWDQEL